MSSPAENAILVVEDDEAINRTTCSYLEKAGYACVPAFSGTEAKLLLGGPHAFRLVICDLMLPGIPGEDIVEHIRSRDADLPVIIVSAKKAVADRIDLLRSGADDYLVKPFDLEELVARVEVQLRKADNIDDAMRQSDANRLRFKGWQLDAAAHTFVANSSTINLTPTEFAIVHALMAAPKRVHTKRSLSTAAGGDAAALDDKAISTHIGNIRAKLRPTGTDGYLETVWGIGFKLAE